MDERRNMFLPYKPHKGCCPLCGGQVRIIESEINEILIDQDGNPKELDPISFTIEGYCVSCNNRLYVDINGNNDLNSEYNVIEYNSIAINVYNLYKKYILNNNSDPISNNIIYFEK